MTNLNRHPDDAMTPVERRRAIQAGQAFDRMPVNLFMPDIKSRMINCSIGDLYLNKEAIVTAELEAYKRYGTDWLFIGPNSKGIAESLGADIVYPKDQMPYIDNYVLKDYQDLDQYKPTNPIENPRLNFFYQVAKELGKQAKDVVNLSVSIGGPLTIASYLRGTEQVLRDMRKNPEQLHQLLAIVVATQKNIIADYINIPDVHFSLADPVASGSLLAPKYFESFVLPYLNELVETVHEIHGSGPSLHICGSVERLWHYIKTLNLATFSIDNRSDLAEAIEYFEGKFRITGNVPPVEVMYKGHRQDVYQAVRACIHAAKGDPRKLTLSVGCDIPYKAPLENIQAYMDCVREYANYDYIMENYGLEWIQ